jgi:hypothetical protein
MYGEVDALIRAIFNSAYIFIYKKEFWKLLNIWKVFYSECYILCNSGYIWEGNLTSGEINLKYYSLQISHSIFTFSAPEYKFNVGYFCGSHSLSNITIRTSTLSSKLNIYFTLVFSFSYVSVLISRHQVHFTLLNLLTILILLPSYIILYYS